MKTKYFNKINFIAMALGACFASSLTASEHKFSVSSYLDDTQIPTYYDVDVPEAVYTDFQVTDRDYISPVKGGTKFFDTDGKYAIRPHEESPNKYDDIYNSDTNPFLKNGVEDILNGKELSPDTDADIWNHLRGGDIIGNGGGIVEAKIAYHYANIPSYIEDCLASASHCNVEGEDRVQLLKIKNIMQEKKNDANRIIFLSGDEHPKFFLGGSIWGARTAKTGFSPKVPIFINTDHLYSNSRPSMTDAEIVTLLIHETGHQANNRDHIYLDRLGVDITDFISQQAFNVDRMYRGKNHELQIINYKAFDKQAEITLFIDDKQVDLKPMVAEALSCWAPGQSMIGFELSNPHWMRAQQRGDYESFPLGAWVRVHCQGANGNGIYKRDMDLRIDLKFSKSVERSLEIIEVNID